MREVTRGSLVAILWASDPQLEALDQSDLICRYLITINNVHFRDEKEGGAPLIVLSCQPFLSLRSEPFAPHAIYAADVTSVDE